MCLGDASCGDESVALTFPQVSSFNLVEPVHVRKMLESREERKAGCEHRQRPAGAFGVALQSCVPGLRRRHRLAVAEASVIPLLWYAASWYCRIVVRCARRTFILGFLRQFVRCTAQCWVPVWQRRHLLAVVDSVVIPLLLPAAPWYCRIAVRCVGTIFSFFLRWFLGHCGRCIKVAAAFVVIAHTAHTSPWAPQESEPSGPLQTNLTGSLRGHPIALIHFNSILCQGTKLIAV